MFCRRIFIFIFLCIGFISSALAQAGEKPNIIFIIFDDLNDYTTTLEGHPQVETPGIQRIENNGTTFINAFTSAPKCAPSRTSFLTGKDLAYTQVYNNPSCRPFRDYFDADYNNEEVFTLPEYMKDYGGYFTYGINKIYHCFDSEYDFDFTTEDPCSKTLSWNKYSLFIDGDDTLVRQIGNDLNEGPLGQTWARIPDSLESRMYDYIAIDSATLFMQQYQSGELNTCDRPFFMMIGLRKPHLAWFIPEKYFNDNYMADYYEEPFNYPYNLPENTTPPNGIIMPPQPDTLEKDYLYLGDLGQYFATYDSIYYSISSDVNGIDPLPEIDPLLTDDEREKILERAISANGVMAYMAAVAFLDAQVSRLMDSLESYPEIYSNTIIVAVSDHGYSLGEKRHWQKGALWETDIRIPFIIADLRNPVAQSAQSAVSLLDLFPTICDLTETPYPTFTDGTPYLDGISFISLLENPELKIEKPVLSSYEEHEGDQCSCYPQFSVRNERFHFIQYQSNSAAGVLTCDEAFSYTESELYEIGNLRETDPNEWNNLISDQDYMPVVNYLQQWLPDSSMYLEKTFKPEVQVNALSCFAEANDTLNLNFILYDTSGTIISPPAGYDYLWTNNLTDDSLYGSDIQFLLSSIDPSDFASNSRLMIFMQMINQSTGVVEGIDLKYIYINPSNIPVATFSVVNNGSMSVCINDYSITGSYTNTWWDFGDGNIIYEDVPGPYTYAEPGTYEITHYVQYGNDNCIATFTAFITVNSMDADGSLDVTFFPNPANSLLNITVPDQLDYADISVIDLLGRTVKTFSYSGVGCYFFCQVDVSDLKPGVYILTVRNEDASFESTFIVAH